MPQLKLLIWSFPRWWALLGARGIRKLEPFERRPRARVRQTKAWLFNGNSNRASAGSAIFSTKELVSSSLTMWHISCHHFGMPTVNIRELRDTRRLKAWLRAGKTIELCDRDRMIARIVPAGLPAEPREWPDFAARRKRLFGQRVLPGADLVIEERARY